MGKKPEETKMQKLIKALTTTMEYRTPEQHKLINEAANDWYHIAYLLGKIHE